MDNHLNPRRLYSIARINAISEVPSENRCLMLEYEIKTSCIGSDAIHNWTNWVVCLMLLYNLWSCPLQNDEIWWINFATDFSLKPGCHSSYDMRIQGPWIVLDCIGAVTIGSIQTHAPTSKTWKILPAFRHTGTRESFQSNPGNEMSHATLGIYQLPPSHKKGRIPHCQQREFENTTTHHTAKTRQHHNSLLTIKHELVPTIEHESILTHHRTWINESSNGSKQKTKRPEKPVGLRSDNLWSIIGSRYAHLQFSSLNTHSHEHNYNNHRNIGNASIANMGTIATTVRISWQMAVLYMLSIFLLLAGERKFLNVLIKIKKKMLTGYWSL